MKSMPSLIYCVVAGGTIVYQSAYRTRADWFAAKYGGKVAFYERW